MGTGVHYTFLSPFVSAGQFSGWKVKTREIQVNQLRRPAAVAMAMGKNTITPAQGFITLLLNLEDVPHPKFSSPLSPPGTCKLAPRKSGCKGTCVFTNKAEKGRVSAVQRLPKHLRNTMRDAGYVNWRCWNTRADHLHEWITKGKRHLHDGRPQLKIKVMGQADTLCLDVLPQQGHKTLT